MDNANVFNKASKFKINKLLQNGNFYLTKTIFVNTNLD